MQHKTKKDTTKDNKAMIDDQVAKKKAIKQQEIEALAKKKLAEEQEAIAKIAAAQATREAEAAARLAQEALAAKERADADAKKAAEEKAKADEETKKAREGKEASLKEIALYESKKKADEEEKKKKADEIEKKRQEGRNKLASKASLWDQNQAVKSCHQFPPTPNWQTRKQKKNLACSMLSFLDLLRRVSIYNRLLVPKSHPRN